MSRTARKMVGMPMFTAIRAMISPRRRRSSMKRVVIMPQVGIHEPRWSPRVSVGTGVAAGPGVPRSVTVVILGLQVAG